MAGLDLKITQLETPKGNFVKAWVNGVEFDQVSKAQVENIADMPFVWPHVAVMPDVHLGKGATVGSVIPTLKAIIPAAVGVDIGCGMMAVRTSLTASQLPDNLAALRSAIEAAVPHGWTNNGQSGDKGAHDALPASVSAAWEHLLPGYVNIVNAHPDINRNATVAHLGTLGGGNHFIEMCLDETQDVWFMLHSGSRGPGNRVGQHFIELAKKDMERWHIHLPDADLAYIPEGSEHFDGYVEALKWAQAFAAANRGLMMQAAVEAVMNTGLVPRFHLLDEAINCHHNYVDREHHYGRNVWITRKGAVRARKGDLGIIPGSMGARSFIVRGLGNPVSLCSCSHGAGRRMSRTAAKNTFTLEHHAMATVGVECRKDAAVIDETPLAYKDIDAVMAAQSDLVEVVSTLKQVLCVKG